MVARKYLLLAAVLLVALVLGLGFAPNFTQAQVTAIKASGTMSVVVNVEWYTFTEPPLCELVPSYQTVRMTEADFDEWAARLGPVNTTMTGLMQKLTYTCQQYEARCMYMYIYTTYGIPCNESLFAPLTFPAEIVGAEFVFPVALSFNNRFPFKVLSVTTNQSVQATFNETPCNPSCSLSGTLSVGSASTPYACSGAQRCFWAPAKLDIKIRMETPIVWGTFQVSSLQKIITVNLEVNPLTGTVQLV